MKVLMTRRLWLPDEAALKYLEDKVDESCASVEIGSKHDVDVAIVASTLPNSPLLTDSALAERVYVAFDKIRGGVKNRVVYHGSNATPGRKFVNALFPEETDEEHQIRGLCCFDQFPLHESEHMRAVAALASMVGIDKKLYATGSRSVPVVLGVDPIASDRRILEEITQNMACGGNRFNKAFKPHWAKPSPVYQEFGETVSGMYFVNQASPLFAQTKADVRSREDIYTEPGFAIEYMTSMLAGAADSVAAGYVYAVRNPFSNMPPAEVERKNALTRAENNSRILAGTKVGSILKAHLDADVDHRLMEFFPRERVNEVREAMRKGFN